MSEPIVIRRPVLAPHARYRWDKVREQHQVVYPEGVLVLNETGAEIVQLCDGRASEELIEALAGKFTGGDAAAIRADAQEYLNRLFQKGLLRDAPAS